MSRQAVLETLTTMGFVKPDRETMSFESLNGISKNIHVFHSDNYGGKIVVQILKGGLLDYPLLQDLVNRRCLKFLFNSSEGNPFYREP